MASDLRLCILGAGSWGTALAISAARCLPHCVLWGQAQDDMPAMAVSRCNQRYLPDIPFPKNLKIESDFASACRQAEVVLIAVPSHAFVEMLQAIKPYSEHLQGIVWVTKGVEPASQRFLSDIYQQTFPDLPYAILQGPSFAKEVATGLPTAVCLASPYREFAQGLADALHHDYFRVYTTEDVIGMQLGGAVKNVLAIAVGIADGLGFGANTKAALITRGLHEMVRLGTALGAKAETLYGLTGLGDLVLTASDNQSRNRRFGMALGQGLSMQQAKDKIQQTIEGINTAQEIHALATRHHIDMPICQQVYAIIHQGYNAQAAVKDLLTRPSKTET